MRAELRADGLHIDGYVNVPGRQSRPVATPHGTVIEVIEQGAFSKALSRAGNINLLLDHDPMRILGDTAGGKLKLKEDAVGLYAQTVITDPDVIAGARAGKLRGWSFGMLHPVDTIEQRENGLPIRHITDLDMNEVTLVMNRIPVYSSTSIEVRADAEETTEETVEIRANVEDVVVEDLTEPEPEQRTDPEPEPTPTPDPAPQPEPEPKPKPDYHKPYIDRINALK